MVTGKKCGNYFEQDQNDLNKHQLDSKQSKKIEYSFLRIKKTIGTNDVKLKICKGITIIKYYQAYSN